MVEVESVVIRLLTAVVVAVSELVVVLESVAPLSVAVVVTALVSDCVVVKVSWPVTELPISVVVAVLVPVAVLVVVAPLAVAPEDCGGVVGIGQARSRREGPDDAAEALVFQSDERGAHR
jgi:hypothetical protein